MNSRFFISSQRLYGEDGLEALWQAHAVVIGIGGVGSWSAETLARSAVGTITLIDMDHISPSNLNRQVHALVDTIGQSKVEAMRERILAISPNCDVRIIDDFVTPENWSTLFAGFFQQDWDSGRLGVIDACDDKAAKMALAQWVLGSQKNRSSGPYVCVGAAGGKRLLAPPMLADLSQVTHDPLLSQIRYDLRKHHHAPRGSKKIGLNCVFSAEAVAKPIVATDSCDAFAFDGNLNCHGYGSSMAVTASFGIAAANYLINSWVQTAKTGKNIL